ncbi:hypothetical protein GCM10010276_21620 [Streptomyces longisporus]|uniref:Uncharacterized protein n=1 Tax=Streptomyces longisporus TaxID=1948 RepID=A0ABN3LG68_STRLO
MKYAWAAWSPLPRLGGQDVEHPGAAGLLAVVPGEVDQGVEGAYDRWRFDGEEAFGVLLIAVPVGPGRALGEPGERGGAEAPLREMLRQWRPGSGRDARTSRIAAALSSLFATFKGVQRADGCYSSGQIRTDELFAMPRSADVS